MCVEIPSKVILVKGNKVKIKQGVRESVVRRVFAKMKSQHDEVTLAYVLMPLVKETGHHNFYARHDPDCSVTLKKENNKYLLYHLGEPRIEAGLKDIENLKKYGGKV